MESEPLKRDEKGRLMSGTPPGPGRPKGKSMKEFAREFLLSMDNDEKIKWLNSLSKDTVWKMAEGHPHQDTKVEHDISDNLSGLIRDAINKGGSPVIPGEDKE